MKEAMKKMLLLVCIVCLGFSGTLTVQAKQDFKNKEAKYDLNKGGIQTYTLLDENNQEYHVTIEPVELNSRLATGTYKITHEIPNAWKGWFYATVSSNTFTSVYSPEAYALKGTVSNYYLVRNFEY